MGVGAAFSKLAILKLLEVLARLGFKVVVRDVQKLVLHFDGHALTYKVKQKS